MLLRLGFEELFLGVYFEGFVDEFEGLVAGEEWCEEHFAVDCRDGDAVVEYEGVVPFLYFEDILFGDLDESTPKEDSFGVEFRVEA